MNALKKNKKNKQKKRFAYKEILGIGSDNVKNIIPPHCRHQCALFYMYDQLLECC